MNTYSAREDADYDWCGEESGYRGHSHVVVCESDDGRVGYAYGNAPSFDADDVIELCMEAEDNLENRERDWDVEAKDRRDEQ